MAQNISASVGLRGVNRPDDTTTIQKLLNQVPAAQGGPSPLLVVDGLCGNKTNSAIQAFQLKQFGWSGADGKVDPGKQTLAKLNTFDTTSPATPKPPDQPPAPPPPPTSTQFVLMRMGSETVIQGTDRQLFFEVVDMTNGRIGIYWLQPPGRPMTTLDPPASFVSPSSRFQTIAPVAVETLDCTAVWFCSEVNGNVQDRLMLALPTGPVQTPLPHHLIGKGGMVSPSLNGGGGNASTAITGQFRFVRMG